MLPHLLAHAGVDGHSEADSVDPAEDDQRQSAAGSDDGQQSNAGADLQLLDWVLVA